MKGQGNRAAAPVIDGSAPAWAQEYDKDLRAYIAALIARVSVLETENTTLKARLKAANIA